MMENKDILKSFVEENLDLIPQEEMILGDVERFEEAYEKRFKRIKFRRYHSRRGVSFLRSVLLPVAASLFIIIAANLFVRNLSSSDLSALPASVDAYKGHYEQVEVLLTEISFKASRLDRNKCAMYEKVVCEVIYEPVSIIDMIPEYLSEDEKVAIIKEYSAAVCASLQSVLDNINN